MSDYNNRILYSSISYQELRKISKWVISGIYKIENLTNHKVYVGQSKDIIYRLKTGHLNLNRECNPYLKRAFVKYGFDNFSFEVIKETYDLNYWEKFLIQLYHSNDFQYGYNILPGGEGGDSEITKQSWKDSSIREKRKIARDSYWQSEKGQKQRRINSERNKSLKQTKGKKWYTNGVIDTVADSCPAGFRPGRTNTAAGSEKRSQSRKDWWNNLTDKERQAHTKKIADGHRGIACSADKKSSISKANKGRKYYNNGEIEVMRFECPEGFVPGRCPKAKASISKGMKSK